jgi:hypothetical protein
MDGVMITAGLLTGDPEPVPVSGTNCGDPGTSSAIAIEAVRAPSACGENVTSMAQVAFAAYGPWQPLVIVKSPTFGPPNTTEEMWSVAAPEFVTVTTCARLVAPCTVFGKERFAGAMVALDRPEMPMPVNVVDCIPAVSVMVVNVAWRGPDAAGVKLTLIAQVELLVVPAGRNAGSKQLGTPTKSLAFAPLTLTAVRFSPTPPELVRLSDLVPLACPT